MGAKIGVSLYSYGNDFIQGKIQEEKLQNFIYRHFDINEKERKYIETVNSSKH